MEAGRRGEKKSRFERDLRDLFMPCALQWKTEVTEWKSRLTDLARPQRTMAAVTEPSPLTTHVLNTADGIPAARMALSLHRLDSRLVIWNLLSVGTTNEDGRCPGLVSRQAFIPGMYKLRFETGSYWEELGCSCFHPYVEVRFCITSVVVYLQ